MSLSYSKHIRWQALIVGFLALLVVSCAGSNTGNILGKKVSFSGLIHNAKSEESNRPELTLVVFWDESECSSCRFSQIADYEEYMSISRSTDGRFRFIVVVSPKIEESSAIKRIVQASGFGEVVYYDIDRVFYKQNSFLPKAPVYHTFLLDENDRIILFGDPFSSRALKEKYNEGIAAGLKR